MNAHVSRTLRTAISCTALAFGACKSPEKKPAPDRPPVLSTAIVPCMEAAGTVVNGRPVEKSTIGAEVCAEQLRQFLLANPEARIVDVIPIDAVVNYPELDTNERQTKDLIVIKADGGVWPLAKDLDIRTTLCAMDARDEKNPAHCAAALAKSLTYSGNASIWIPLTFEEDRDVFNRRSGTTQILQLYPRAEASSR